MKQLFFFGLLIAVLSSKLNAQTSFFNAIYWGTYFNDNVDFPNFNFANTDLIDQIAVDNVSESVYVVGQSFAPPHTAISVCSGNQSIQLGSGNGYLAKYNRCGEIQWSTFLGEKTQCLILDVQNGKTIIYVAGNIKEATIPGQPAFKCDDSPSPIFQTENVDHSDAFIAKYEDNDTAVSLLRWTYFGGTKANNVQGGDNIYGIDVYKHNIFFVGATASTNLAAGAQHKYDSTKANGPGDGFIAEFDSMLSTLKFFTYVGADGNDRFHDIKVYEKGSNNVALYASGTTTSSTEIASGTGFDQSYNSPDDAFLQRWEDTDHDGIFTKTWGTYIGGNSDEHSRATQVDRDGNVFLTGWTRSSDLPVTSFAYDKLFGADGSEGKVADDYIIKINKDGGNEWCTYFGSERDERINGLDIFRKEGVQYVVIAGLTRGDSSFFPLKNPLQVLLNGNGSNQYYDAFIAILDDATTSQQQLIQSTYIGGSKAEGIQIGKSYHPSVAVGPHREIYLVTATQSGDINTVVGNEFKHLIHPYNGGSDAFIAKLVDSTNTNQTGCTFLNLNKTVESVSQFNFDAYPNPVRDETTISIFSNETDKISLEVYNSLQQLISTQSVLLDEGENLISLKFENLSPGIYFILVKTTDGVLTKKIVKQ